MCIRDSREAVRAGTDHVSAYNLTYEEDTEFFRSLLRGEMCIRDRRCGERRLHAVYHVVAVVTTLTANVNGSETAQRHIGNLLRRSVNRQ